MLFRTIYNGQLTTVLIVERALVNDHLSARPSRYTFAHYLVKLLPVDELVAIRVELMEELQHLGLWTGVEGEHCLGHEPTTRTGLSYLLYNGSITIRARVNELDA
jgi:hypothetical protein